MRELLLISFLWTVTMTSVCTAQSYQQDAGPPPTQVAPVPTLKQAQDFFVENVESHGKGSCEPILSSEYKSMYSVHVKLADDKITIQQIFQLYSDRDNNNKAVATFVAPLSELSIIKGSTLIDPSYPGTYKCKYPDRILFFCKAGAECFKGRSVVHRVFDGSVKDTDEATSEGTLFFHIDDAAVAERMLKAILFYQKSLPPPAPSPF